MKFIADDGKIFDTMAECEEHEKISNEGYEIARLWYNYINTYDDTGRMIESSYDYTKEIKDYLDDTVSIVVDDTIFLDILCSKDEWNKIKNYFDKEYGVALPSYARGFHRYDYDTEEWTNFHNDYEAFKKKWEPLGIRF